jgi:molybdopterin biosynthesis enzyme
LWSACFGSSERVLVVPGAADADIPPPQRDPYPASERLRCVFAGTVYSERAQPEANRAIVDKLNALGRALAARRGRLFVVGVGNVKRLDRTAVTYLGRVTYDRSWDYLHHAHVGVVVSAGPFMHNNESSKIYHYLRAGLPVVSESGFPNDNVVREAQCGVIVDGSDMNELADAVVETARTRWNKARAVAYIRAYHTWTQRVKIYDDLLTRECN